VLGVALGEGSGGIALLAAIFAANLPEALVSSASMRTMPLSSFHPEAGPSTRTGSTCSTRTGTPSANRHRARAPHMLNTHGAVEVRQPRVNGSDDSALRNRFTVHSA
jgi:hypothetical protein